MSRKRITEEKIIGMPREAEVFLTDGKKGKDLPESWDIGAKLLSFIVTP